jgi:hypothetical protein
MAKFEILAYKPYPDEYFYVFDDPDKLLLNEALVGGTPAAIMHALDISHPGASPDIVRIIISDEPSDDLPHTANLLVTAPTGSIYHFDGFDFWLCPALFLYFGSAPEAIYFSTEPGEKQAVLDNRSKTIQALGGSIGNTVYSYDKIKGVLP